MKSVTIKQMAETMKNIPLDIETDEFENVRMCFERAKMTYDEMSDSLEITVGQLDHGGISSMYIDDAENSIAEITENDGKYSIIFADSQPSLTVTKSVQQNRDWNLYDCQMHTRQMDAEMRKRLSH